MTTGDVLAEAFGRIRQLVEQSARGLDAAQLAFRPETDANSIAWLAWHLTRIQDHHVSEIADRPQSWIEDRWFERFGMESDPSRTGNGDTSAQVAALRPENPEQLVGYQDSVYRRTLEYLSGVEAEELDRVIDRSYDPPVTVGVRLVSVLSDNLQHAGQARYVRGIIDRIPNPS